MSKNYVKNDVGISAGILRRSRPASKVPARERERTRGGTHNPRAEERNGTLRAEEQTQAHTQTLRRDLRSAANGALRLRWWSIVQRTNAGVPNAMRGCDEAPQSVLTHSVRSGTLRGPRSALFSARTRERTTSYATEVRDTQKGRKVRP